VEQRPKTSEGTKTGGGRLQSKTAGGRLQQKIGAKTPTAGGELPAKPGFFDKLIEKVNRLIVEWLLKNALPPSGAVVMQAGSGVGEAASLLASAPSVELSVALDYRLETLKIAKARDPRLGCVRGDLFRLPFKPGAFDMVWSNSMLEHIHDKRRVVCEMVRTTRDGGCVFVGVPYANGPLMIQPWIAKTKLGKKIGGLFNEESLAIDLEGTGLAMEGFVTFHYRTFLGCVGRKS
jgi:SAM-dependent methyltransferase